MNLTDFDLHADFSITGYFALAALVAIVALLYIYGDQLFFTAVPLSRALERTGSVAVAVLVIGVLGVVITGVGSASSAYKSRNESFHSALQATYGATTDVDLSTAEKGSATPVHTVRGNELVTFRETGGQLVAFRADGTELPRG